MLKKWGIKDSDKCSLCGQEIETLSHLFVLCEQVQDFWIQVETLMGKYDNEKINFAVERVLCNKLVDNPGKIQNFICLLAKQYIYSKRCLLQNIEYYEFVAKVRRIKAMEKYNATQSNKLGIFKRKWGETDGNQEKESTEMDNTNFITQYINSQM